MKNTQDKCPSTKFTGKVEKTPLIRFVKSQELPKYVSTCLMILIKSFSGDANVWRI